MAYYVTQVLKQSINDVS